MTRSILRFLIPAFAFCLLIFYSQLLMSPFEKTKTVLQPFAYQHLPAWNSLNLKPSLEAFQRSCEWLMKQSPNKHVGNRVVPLKAKDFQPACQRATQLHDASNVQIRQFFEQNFTPVRWKNRSSKPGLFTGYFSPFLKGSLHRTETYSVPVYGPPKDLAKRGHHYTRAQINQGAIRHKAPIHVWLRSEIERLNLEIQGAGIVFVNNRLISLGYDSENGAPYRSIPQYFIKRGIFTKDTASIKNIQRYIKTHPAVGKKALNSNPSFVFFNKSKTMGAPSAHLFPLTPGYSMAVDKKWIPLGIPVLIHTKNPISKGPKTLHRLMVAQDVGGAIKGKVRGDIFWGIGDAAAKIANQTKAPGMLWLLLPKVALS
ncbi:MAG: MltA domain-containing protein [Gammaproteobacteria bacterium]|nr:MltA domain-containing protein [Gammaproteobacteria bacterium]